MVSKNFRLNCALRVILICGSILLFFYLLYETNLRATTFIIGLVVVYQFISLFSYVEKTNRELSRFLRSIKYSDFSQSFTSEASGAAFRELNEAFSEVIDKFQLARKEKEEHFRYLQTVVQHIGIGLIAYTRDGDIELINNAARRLFKIPRLKKIDQLRKVSPKLAERLLNLQPGEKDLIRLQSSEGESQIFIYSTGFILHEQSYILVSLQNIQSALEEKEMDAWQNLIRVLTHEIMNSITPISSLASTASVMLTRQIESGEADFNSENMKDVIDAIRTIEKRSVSLLQFVENYRKLTKIPKPYFQIVRVRDLLDRIEKLMRDQIQNKNISWHTAVSPSTLEITADPVLIEQTMINLCKNALEAVSETSHPEISLKGMTDEQGNPVIQVKDNGCGIKPEVLDNIFIPFFTTKKEGSGIGLSLSKQVMRQHRGTITVTSIQGKETVFTLRF